MGKKITIASYDIDIKGIESKLSELRAQLNEDSLGGDFAKKLSKEISALEIQLEKVKNAYPGAGATQRQIDNYNKKMESLRIAISSFGKGAVDSFDDSNDYIKKNIKSLEEYVNKVAEVNAELDKIKEGKKVPELNVSTRKGETKGSVKSMREAAERGDRAGVLAAYDSYSKKQNAEIRNLAKTKGKDSEEYRTAVADRENVHAIEDAYKNMAEAVIAAKKRLAAAQQEESDAILKARNAMTGAFQDVINGAAGAEDATKNVQVQLSGLSDEIGRAEEESKNFTQIENRIKALFSAGMALQTVRRIVRSAIQDFQELDKQFNEIAIVSDYTTAEMWEGFKKVNKVAQEFGVETKNVLEVQNLYYHQGKSMAEVNKLTAQTLTLAKITGMDYASATSNLTAVLNAYNIAAEDAVRVTDTIAAMDTNAAISSEELMTALTKTASIAANAGMSLESTEIFLTKMIETTREAPENLGTALKTIIARFGEVKQEVDGEIVELADINRVDTALKSVGISLLDTAGQIRDLDDVFMELSSIWDGLDRNTQRYIATISAGSRQQSRFIAMMEDYDRTLELTEIAQDSAGIGARQLAKSMESIETSVNRLKSTWQEFYSNFISSGIIKTILDTANALLSLINKISDIHPLLGVLVTSLSLWGAKTLIVEKGLKILGQAMGQNVAATLGANESTELLVSSLSDEEITTRLASSALSENTKELLENEQAARKAANAQKEFSEATETKTEEKTDNKEEETNDENQTPQTESNIIDFKTREPVKIETDNIEIDSEKTGDEFKQVAEDFSKNIKTTFLDSKKKEFGEETIKQTLKNNFGIKDGAGFFGNIKNMFSTGKANIANIKNLVSGGIKKTATQALTKIGPTITKIAGTLPKIIGTVTKLINPVTAVIAAVGVGYAIYRKVMGQTLDDTKKVEKLEKAQENYNKSLEEYNSLKEKSKVIEKYRNKKNLTAEQLQEQQDAAKELVAEYPNLLDHIDEEGNYHLKNADAIEKEIAAKEALVDMNAKTYTELRLKYAEQGIYADEATLAGQSMKNLKDYASMMDEDTMKDVANKIDTTDMEGEWGDLNFNKSRYYEAMEAYASGEKTSFGYREFSDWFAGDIGKDSWQELLQIIEEKEIDVTDKDALADALKETGAYYSEGNAEEAAATFVALNEEMGGILGSLLEGAAYEQAEILIENAKVTMNKWETATDLGEQSQEAIAEAALAKAIADAGGKEEWNELSEEDRQSYINNYLSQWESTFEAMDSGEIKQFEKVMSEETSGGISISKLNDLESYFFADGELKTDFASMTTAVQEYWNSLDEEVRESMPDMQAAIASGEEEVIRALFSEIAGYVGNEDLSVDEFMSDYNSSMNSFIDPTALTNYGNNLKDFLNSFTGDQFKALTSKTSDLHPSQFAPYINALYEAYLNKIQAGKNEQELLNTLLGTDLTSFDSVMNNLTDFTSLGFSTTEIIQMMGKASNGTANIMVGNLDEINKAAEGVFETYKKGIEGMQSLMEGTGTTEQLKDFFDQMTNYYTEQISLGEMTLDDVSFSGLSEMFTATGKGFSVASEGIETYSQEIFKNAQNALIFMTQLKMAEARANEDTWTDAQKIENSATIETLKLELAYLDAIYKQAQNDALVKTLEEEKEKADKLLDSLKALVDWLREYDRFANLDKAIETLEKDFAHAEFEIGFSTNADVIAENITKEFDSINSQIAANQGGIRAAREEQKIWRDTIEKRNSKYISFDESGNAIANAKELQKLQENIADATEEDKMVLQAEYDEIMSNMEAYDKAKDKIEEYSTALEDNFGALKDTLNKVYESIRKVEDKLIQVRQEKEDEELDAIKKKYDAIKEEDQKYLDSVRKTVEKEREIRDRNKQEDDVRKKEKKLAMMRMDTSGIYSADIRSLEEELEEDYQSLEDDAIDKKISEIEEAFNTQAEAMEKEIKYFDNALQYKRDNMLEYNAWANELITSGSDAVLSYLKENDKEYYTGTAAAKNAWSLEWANATAQAVGSNQWLGQSLHHDIFNNLDACTTAAGGFEQAVEKYSEKAVISNQIAGQGLPQMVEDYYNLAENVNLTAEAFDALATAYRSAASALQALNTARGYTAQGSVPEIDDNLEIGGGESAGTEEEKPTFEQSEWLVNYISAPAENVDAAEKIIGADGDTYIYWEDSSWGEKRYVKLKYLMYEPLTDRYYVDYINEAWAYVKYASGGLADYTGPAWLDGTPSKPEMVLNPSQTAAFIKLVDILDLIKSPMSSSSYDNIKASSSQGESKTEYNFNIEVSQMASDYDVDKMISRIEEKIAKTAKYRQVTTVTKSR